MGPSTKVQEKEQSIEDSDDDDNGTVCRHRFCTSSGCHRIPEEGYPCIAHLPHACCKPCFCYHEVMPEGGYRPWKPVPHDEWCDRANPKSAKWDIKKRETEEAYLGRKNKEDTSEVFKELCSHPWKFKKDFLEEMAPQKGFPEEPIPEQVPVEEREVPEGSLGVNCPWSGLSSGSNGAWYPAREWDDP